MKEVGARASGVGAATPRRRSHAHARLHARVLVVPVFVFGLFLMISETSWETVGGAVSALARERERETERQTDRQRERETGRYRKTTKEKKKVALVGGTAKGDIHGTRYCTRPAAARRSGTWTPRPGQPESGVTEEERRDLR